MHVRVRARPCAQRILPEDDRCVVRVDVVDKETLLDPRPDTAVRTSRPAYSTGDHLMILQKANCRDAIVLDWLGSTGETVHRGGRHRVRFWPLSADPAHDFGPETEDEIRDLNDYNHAVQVRARARTRHATRALRASRANGHAHMHLPMHIVVVLHTRACASS